MINKNNRMIPQRVSTNFSKTPRLNHNARPSLCLDHAFRSKSGSFAIFTAMLWLVVSPTPEQIKKFSENSHFASLPKSHHNSSAGESRNALSQR